MREETEECIAEADQRHEGKEEGHDVQHERNPLQRSARQHIHTTAAVDLDAGGFNGPARRLKGNEDSRGEQTSRNAAREGPSLVVLLASAAQDPVEGRLGGEEDPLVGQLDDDLAGRLGSVFGPVARAQERGAFLGAKGTGRSELDGLLRPRGCRRHRG